MHLDIQICTSKHIFEGREDSVGECLYWTPSGGIEKSNHSDRADSAERAERVERAEHFPGPRNNVQEQHSSWGPFIFWEDTPWGSVKGYNQDTG